jgi:CheY-like chemotaxis protein
VAIQQDVSEELELQARLARSQTLEVVGRLAGGIGHDFNNLLQVMVICAESASDTLGEQSEVQEELAQIVETAYRGADLVSKLLIFSRDTVSEEADLDLNEVMRDVAKLLRRTLGEDVALRLELADALPSVCGSRVGLQQVLMNLAVNARHAMPGGGELVMSTCAVTDAAGGWVRLTVRDTGCGMTPEVREHLFEPYFTTKQDSGGTGLGLATVYGVVTKAGGRIEVQSQPGEGACFEIDFPARAGAGETLAAAPPAAAAPSGGETILVVEDEGTIRDPLCRMLEHDGYRVLAAADGATALRLARAHPTPIDLLLSDVVMPGMSGSQLALRLRADQPGVKVLFMSGYAESHLYTQGLEAEQARMLAKPFNANEVRARIRETLDE